MLKRYQVLLNTWLVEHMRAISIKYDLSQSEVMRLLLCLQISKLVCQGYPKAYKCAPIEKKILNLIKKRNKNHILKSEEIHNLISKIYFEARKATEVWHKEEAKRKKNKL